MGVVHVRVLLVAFAVVLSAMPAAAQTGAVCSVSGSIELDPGVSMTPSQGTFSGSATMRCTGTVSGRGLAGPGTISYAGTYGAGPFADPQGGNTCLAGSGDATFTATLRAVDGDWVVVSGSFHADAIVPLSLDLGSSGDGVRLAGVVLTQPVSGDCLTTTMTRGAIAGYTLALG